MCGMRARLGDHRRGRGRCGRTERSTRHAQIKPMPPCVSKSARVSGPVSMPRVDAPCRCSVSMRLIARVSGQDGRSSCRPGHRPGGRQAAGVRETAPARADRAAPRTTGPRETPGRAHPGGRRPAVRTEAAGHHAWGTSPRPETGPPAQDVRKRRVVDIAAAGAGFPSAIWSGSRVISNPMLSQSTAPPSRNRKPRTEHPFPAIIAVIRASVWQYRGPNRAVAPPPAPARPVGSPFCRFGRRRAGPVRRSPARFPPQWPCRPTRHGAGCDLRGFAAPANRLDRSRGEPAGPGSVPTAAPACAPPGGA